MEGLFILLLILCIILALRGGGNGIVIKQKSKNQCEALPPPPVYNRSQKSTAIQNFIKACENDTPLLRFKEYMVRYQKIYNRSVAGYGVMYIYSNKTINVFYEISYAKNISYESNGTFVAQLTDEEFETIKDAYFKQYKNKV